MNYDVVIAGASIAGCTAAAIYGQAGLRVALLERNPSMSSYKGLCGHFILGGARATLERLRLWERLLDEGAATTERLAVWSPAGWIVPRCGDAPTAISIRRRKLDPILREMAASRPGVDLLMGHTVTGVLQEGGVVVGLGVTTRTGKRVEVLGRLVVGADGHHSTVSRLAGVPEAAAPNRRFLYWAYYRGVKMRGPGDGQVWLLDPDVAVCDSTDEGLTQLGVFPSKARLGEFAEDRVTAFERFVAALPDGPSLERAERVSKVIGTTDYPCVRRHPVPRPRLALIGDAATASDPVPAVGCGWAFRSAEWLADATTPALAGDGSLDTGLRRYRRAHRLIERYDSLGRKDARALRPNPIQRAIWTASVHDAELARRMAMFGMRAAAPSVLLNPRTVARALSGAALHRRRYAFAGRPDTRGADSPRNALMEDPPQTRR